MINIKFKSCALFMFFVCTLSANVELPLIGGKINDINSGESLPYAKVTIKDTNRVSTANQDGSFTILNIPVGSILVINKMGYESKEIKVSSDTKRLIINLYKLEKDSLIEDVVVVGSVNSNMMQQSGIS
ncbi:MAG: carboxypeptidase-like regulatory domain-containing protein, partial [Proteobacteria bacterium]|nr:carboxypeptidase-like regulatory domain-containing protein [Pseudomonadota bacterium]